MFESAFNWEFKVPIGKNMYILRVEMGPNNTFFCQRKQHDAKTKKFDQIKF